MALTYVQRNTLLSSATFAGRIRSAILKYAIYLRNSHAAGNLGRWAAEVIDNAVVRELWVTRLTSYVIENVAAAGALSGADDSDATDSAISGQVEVQVQEQVA